MRLGVLGPIAPDSFAENFLHACLSMEIDAIALGTTRARHRSARVNHLFNFASDSVVTLADRAQSRLVDTAIAADCDAVICLSNELMPFAVHRLRDAKIRTALWFPDCVSNIGRQIMLAADYDRVYFKDPLLVDRLRSQTQLPVGYLPEACNPAWHRPPEEFVATSSVALVGNMYPSRVRVLEALDDAGIAMTLYGSGFPRWLPSDKLRAKHVGREVVRGEKAEVFRASAGVLNNLHPAENGMNCRLFEAAGSGAAVLCEHREALDSLFSPDEVLSYRSLDDLIKYARKLLTDHDFGRRLGDAAAQRAQAEHTYQHRIPLILEDIL